MNTRNKATARPRSELSPIEQLRAAASHAFPDIDELAKTDIRGNHMEVWERLSKAAGVTTQEFAIAIADTLGFQVIDDLRPEPGVLSLVPLSLARSELLLPLREENNHLYLATALPFGSAGIDQARFATGKNLELCIAPPEDLDLAIHEAYQLETDRLSGHVSSMMLDEGAEQKQSHVSSATEKLARSFLTKAINMRASDMHLHPFHRGSEVRYRIDGVLKRVVLLPDGVGDRIIRYFKAHGEDMDPTVNNIPQDGRMALTVEGRQFDLRISALPASGGESLVIRFLEQGRVYSLSNTELSLASLQIIRRLLTNSSGIILMTGPTGSGKSSTLYSMVAEINRIGINIITIENPVEYRVPGITQVEVHEKAGLTFPSVIRSCMRQDPDVMLIGEIRDQETAQIAVQAAVTGHLVLSTLHTNDAVTSISRLAGLGIDPTVLSDALIGIIAQRLVRRLCKKCRVPVDEKSLTVEEELFKDICHVVPSYRSTGCESCVNTGYWGRLPVVEIFELTSEISQTIAEGNINTEKLKRENQGQNKTLAGSAARLVISGETTVFEAARVVGKEFWSDLAYEYGTKAPAAVPVLKEKKETVSSVLLMSSDKAFISNMEKAFHNKHISCYACQTTKQANKLLHEHEEIFFIIFDLQDRPDKENVEFIRNARIELYWSYIPSITLLPPERPELKDTLIADGSISEMHTKPVEHSHIVERIRVHATGSLS